MAGAQTLKIAIALVLVGGMLIILQEAPLISVADSIHLSLLASLSGLGGLAVLPGLVVVVSGIMLISRNMAKVKVFSTVALVFGLLAIVFSVFIWAELSLLGGPLVLPSNSTIGSPSFLRPPPPTGLVELLEGSGLEFIGALLAIVGSVIALRNSN